MDHISNRNHEHAQSKEVTMTRMKAKLNTAIHDKRRLTSANVKQEGIMKRFQLDYYELAQHMEVLLFPVIIL